MSLDRMIERIAQTQNPTVAGLDPLLAYIPEHILENSFAECGRNFQGAADALYHFNCALIDALCDIVPAVKPQAAYYELYGYEGVKALAKTIRYAQEKGMFVITDGKRNDIGSTMQAYAAAHLGVTDIAGEQTAAFGGDALTVNGYLGTDGIEPLIKVCDSFDKGVFVLVKTSNPSSGELQDMVLSTGKTVYHTLGVMCEQWGENLKGRYGYSGVGAVVGATYPKQLLELRKELKRTFFLVPGYGAQGAGVEDVLPAFDDKGLGAIINSSRAILCAWKKEECDPKDYAGAARREAIRMRDEIMSKVGEICL